MALAPTTRALPVLPLDDAVVLPGMVVPLDLTDREVSAAVDAARAERTDSPELLLVPRPDGKYAAYGTLAVIEQTVRLRGGQSVAVVPGTRRSSIGPGTTRPRAAPS